MNSFCKREKIPQYKSRPHPQPPGIHPLVLTGGQDDPKGGTVVSGEHGGAEAERAERHAGDGGEGEDGEEREGAVVRRARPP